jgi:hypothetical protein
MEKLDTLYFKEFNGEQKELACSIINRFGSGQHPCADNSTIDGFATSYLKELLDSKKFKDASVNLSELGKKTVEEIKIKLQ